MLRAMIVDDEAPARSELRFLLEQTGKIGTITEASSVRSAIEMLMESRVDVVFLDISMPGASGLQLAEALHKLKNPPAIVFVTAYSDHAVEAFDVDAVDYLIAEHQKHPSSPWMFPSPKTGEMYHPDSVVNIHKKILKDAGLEHLRFHDLRHTFATLALQNGVDVKTVSSMLGHFDAGFTLRTYTHVTRQMQESAAEKMGNFMAQVM